MGTAWLHAGMDHKARPVTLEIDKEVADIVRNLVTAEPHVHIVHGDEPNGSRPTTSRARC